MCLKFCNDTCSNIVKFAYLKISLLVEFYSVDKLDKKNILISFGNALRELRLAKGFTQEQLANELGIEISQISRIERGVINTSVTTLYSISKVLKIDVSELFRSDKSQ
jgi:DNA-binding XRE family transcriptional regulator